MEVRSGSLALPGCQLYYELRGSGPLILLIHGGTGDANAMNPLAAQLADRFTVITYDRRGHSRSHLEAGWSPIAGWIGAHAEDAQRLLAEIAEEPAIVFGTSSGAVIALDLSTRYATQIRTLIAHEPPLVGLLADPERWRMFFSDIYERYRTVGVGPAMQEFLSTTGIKPQPRGTGERAPGPPPANVVFWLETELREAPSFGVDLDALSAMTPRIMVGGGEASHSYYPYLASEALARRVGAPVVEFPGGHIGPTSDPIEFASRLGEVL